MSASAHPLHPFDFDSRTVCHVLRVHMFVNRYVVARTVRGLCIFIALPTRFRALVRIVNRTDTDERAANVRTHFDVDDCECRQHGIQCKCEMLTGWWQIGISSGCFRIQSSNLRIRPHHSLQPSRMKTELPRPLPPINAHCTILRLYRWTYGTRNAFCRICIDK